MREKNQNKIWSAIFLIFFGIFLITGFDDITVVSKQTDIDVTPPKKYMTSVVFGRLGYVLYDNGTAAVVDETGAVAGLQTEAVDIIIPPEISYEGKTYQVTEVGQRCFYDGVSEERTYGRIVLPDTVQVIGTRAFYRVSCEELVIPDTVCAIGEYAFCFMSVDKDFYYPSGCKEIPQGALFNIRINKGKLVIPETVTRICGSALATNSPVCFLCDTPELEEQAIVWLNEEKLEIGGKQGFTLKNGMLLNQEQTELIKCLKVTEEVVKIPDTVHRIYPFAFLHTDVRHLPKKENGEIPGIQVYLPEGLRELEERVFYQSDWIEQVYLPVSLKKIADHVFDNTVRTLIFQTAEVPELGKNNFVDEVKVPDIALKRYTSGLKGKFSYKKLSTFVMEKEEEQKKEEQQVLEQVIKDQALPPDMVLQDHVLYTLYSDGSAEVTRVGEEKPAWMDSGIDELGLDELMKGWIGGYLGDIHIPSVITKEGKRYTVTSIGSWAFAGSFQCGEILLPETVTRIGDYAFTQLHIRKITIPDSVKEMGIGVFEDVTVEEELRFPASIKTVPYRTFYRAAAARIVIPDTVTRLDRYAVVLDRYEGTAGGLPGQKIEVILSKNLKEAGECSFYASPKYCVVKLTGKGENVIQDGMLFNKNETELIMALEPKTGDYHIPETVRRIHAYAFSAVSQEVDPTNGATGRIWVPEGVKVLEKGTFRNCFWLKSLSLPSTIERIETGAWSCVSLNQSEAGNGLRNLVIKAKNPPEIIGKQKTLRYINVPNSSIADYEEALSGKVGYKKLY